MYYYYVSWSEVSVRWVSVPVDWPQVGGGGPGGNPGVGEDLHQQRAQQPHRPWQRHRRHQVSVKSLIN